MCLRCSFAAVVVLGLSSCQGYPFAYEPDRDRQGAHLRFTVEQPSLVDMLFVIDNSSSMTDEQAALRTSLTKMLEVLAPKDSHYRIGIASTDAHGFDEDCCGAALPPTSNGDRWGNRGSCGRCDNCNSVDPTTRCELSLRRPHDGARGRLIAAFDPQIFDVDAVDAFGRPLYDLAPELRPIFSAALPTGLYIGGSSASGEEGARWVIDRQTITAEACAACNCGECVRSPVGVQGCFEQCVEPIAAALVTAYFNANIAGLGLSGWGWEEGLKAALLAVGIDPEETVDDVALSPGGSHLRPGGANTLQVVDPSGAQSETPWIRDDAVLAVVILTDEEDCSMPSSLMDLADAYEGQRGLPVGSLCYQDETRSQLLSVARMRRLLSARKDSALRLAVCMIGGLAPTGYDQAAAVDCRDAAVSPPALPPTDCSCLTGSDDPGWCELTTDWSGTGPTCDALAAHRYLDFGVGVDRRTFDSVCRSGVSAFGPALAECARIATETCFDLKDVTPAQGDPSLLLVERASRAESAAGLVPRVLERVDSAHSASPPGGGWYYDQERNAVCLVGLDRLVGDVYDIFVLNKNQQ